MTNQIAIGIGIVLLGLFGLDVFLTGSANTLFLLRKLADLIEYLAFWR